MPKARRPAAIAERQLLPSYLFGFCLDQAQRVQMNATRQDIEEVETKE
jgi:hypothetical protein